jgi:hypothetical protein
MAFESQYGIISTYPYCYTILPQVKISEFTSFMQIKFGNLQEIGDSIGLGAYRQVYVSSTLNFVEGIQKFETAFNAQVRNNYRLDHPLYMSYSKVKISL